MGIKVTIMSGTVSHTYWTSQGALPRVGEGVAFDGIAGRVTDVTWLHLNEVQVNVA